jgi:phenylacetic acid degradation operon negative regulatory protein
MSAQRPDAGRPVAAVHDRHLPAITPLTARSVVLSVLLGYHPPALPVSALVRVAGLFGVAERTTRVALSRMVADGDLTSTGGTYRLTDRLVRRQARQEDAASPRLKPWRGEWEMAVVTGPARPQPDRVALRRNMVDLRLAELREGVWIRPDNLAREPDGPTADQCTFFRCRHPDPDRIVARLWNLHEWGATARGLHDDLAEPADLKGGFLLIAEVVHHLRLDPCLPARLLPDGWPSDALRSRYLRYRDDFARRLRDYATR